MPGYANWKSLYDEEYLQMLEEGYDMSGLPEYDAKGDRLLPFPGCESPETDGDQWEKAYMMLKKRLGAPLRDDYPYVEPSDFESILACAGTAPETSILDEGVYFDRLRGAIYGRFAAVILGKPLEMGLNYMDVRRYLEGADAWPLNDYIPENSPGSGMHARGDCIPSTRGNVRYAQGDDDINYTLLAMLLAERHGLEFTPAQVGENWLDNIPYHWLWCASRQAYYHMVNQTPVELIPNLYNPWRECIDGQIRSDLWGYISPGNMKRAALLAYRDCSFSLTKNGIYGGMFTAGCIAAAITKYPSVDLILDGGLSVIPHSSRLAEMVRTVRNWYEKEPDRDKVCEQIWSRWGHLPFAGTVNNMAIVVLSILDGNLDYSRTITSAVCCGIDTDCNAGTAGSIVGAAVGIDGIDKKWYEPLNDTLKTGIAEIGEISITEVVKRIFSINEKLNT